LENNISAELEQAAAIYNMITEFFVEYSFQILGAMIILLIGLFIAKRVSNLVFSLCEKKGIDITLSRFIAATSKIIIVTMVAIIALGKLGISVTPFLAAIGALSLGAGLAAQGLLSNYGAGFTIILTRPFVVGDTISVQGVSGQVKEVHLAYTLLNNEDDIEISIPNKHIVGEIIHNSYKCTLAEVTIGVAYSEAPEQVVDIIRKAIETVVDIEEGKTPIIGIEKFAASSIDIGIRILLPTHLYYQTLYQMNQAVYKALQDNNINIPYPQREIRILDQANGQ
jgi:small conductance mechanosensitive channel